MFRTFTIELKQMEISKYIIVSQAIEKAYLKGGF